MDTRRLAESALTQIAGTPRGHVYASRKGVVAGVVGRNEAILFRRVGKRVQLERWPGNHANIEREWLPPDLAERAKVMLDNL